MMTVNCFCFIEGSIDLFIYTHGGNSAAMVTVHQGPAAPAITLQQRQVGDLQ
jgi:hypothetical protein